MKRAGRVKCVKLCFRDIIILLESVLGEREVKKLQKHFINTSWIALNDLSLPRKNKHKDYDCNNY